MKTKLHCLFIALALLALSTLNLQLSTVLAQGTAFIYDGKLNDGANPANGSYDVTFTLFATNNSGSAVAGPVTNSATGVTNGLFTATIDFGAGVFTGSNYWLELAVRTNSGGSFSTLAPRQPILPTPYAIYAPQAGSALTAGSAGSANSVSAANISGTIPLAQLPAGVITNNSVNLTLGSTNEIAPLTVPPTVPAAAIGSTNTGTSPSSVAVAGRYAYVTAVGGTFQIFDVSTPSAPVSVSSLAVGGNPNSVAVAGRYAYVTASGGTLQVFDVSTPSAPVSVSSVNTGSDPDSIVVAGRYAYIVNANVNTLQIFDVGNPSAPVSVGSVGTGNGPNSLAVAGRYAYVANYGTYGGNSLQIFDVSNPSAPVSVASVGTAGNPAFLTVAGHYVYVGNINANTMQIFDVSIPSAPVSIGSVATVGGGARSIAVAGRYAYVTADGGTLQIVDVSTPSAPVSIGSVSTGNLPYCIAVGGRYAYVVNYYGSTLQVFDLGGAYLQQLEAGAVETGTLQTRDTVTVGNNLNVRGGLTASGSARISGGLSVDNINIAGGVTTNIIVGGNTFFYTNGVLMNIQ